jgi:hypothetical protein
MTEFNDDLEEDMDDEDWEDAPSFGEQLYNSISPTVKQFLIDHYGEELNNASPQTFLDIEAQIKEDIFLHADFLPHYLRLNRTITDAKEWETAFQNFKPGNVEVTWPTLETWYDQSVEDDTDDEYIDSDELTPDQEQAKKIMDAADELLDHHALFADFVKKACRLIITEVQQYLQKNAAFDLSILSPEGFIQVQQCIGFMAGDLAENLFAITEELRDTK